MIILEILVGMLVVIVSFIAYKIYLIHVNTKINFSSKVSQETMLKDYKNFGSGKGTGTEIPIETLTTIKTMNGDVHISSEKLGKTDVSDLTNKIKNLRDK